MMKKGGVCEKDAVFYARSFVNGHVHEKPGTEKLSKTRILRQ